MKAYTFPTVNHTTFKGSFTCARWKMSFQIIRLIMSSYASPH